ncbi:adenylate/guanylate cyclase domain-containing protein [Phyllobacterium zundukense]|uniref:Adenylate/guanylate cyclase domain-containing protein n=1 Tax=Phyllobacterium zundukense TaxID=1867719 RepID=A0ACD4CZP2_9HYPH|nr:adenylate/guanylate cyclase domain-containing protein [Phyllobacterium zundukense]UXN59075.1 adenylate/guanylate cyclase domain-containing protein [Phyllobacterium zundukense]
MDRKLVTILAADVVGYSTLMEQDEQGTFERLRAGRKELFEPEIARHHGRIFKLMGDGLLAEFGSVVDAVECAVSLQRGLAERNVNVIEDQRIKVRIGINLGEVIVEGDDCYGDGVNIAARLEQLADSGGICVSAKVAREVEKKLSFVFEAMGEQKVKNIAEPIQIFRVKFDGIPLPPRRAGKQGKYWPTAAVGGLIALLIAGGGVWYALQRTAALARESSIAVLPFANMSGDPAQDYLGSGIAEDIITMLSSYPGLRVVSRTSSFVYDKPVKVQQVGDDLKVNYVIEGSVRKAGNNVRVTAQLVDASTGEHVWADRYDEEGSDVPALQDDVANRIYATVAGMKGEIRKKEEIDAWSKSAPGLEEYDYYLRGHQFFFQFTKDGNEKGRVIWQEGLAKFPDSALLRTKIAASYMQNLYNDWTDDPWRDTEMAWKMGTEAAAIPHKSRLETLLSHWMMAPLYQLHDGDFARSVVEAEAAAKLVPYDAFARADLAYYLVNAGKYDLAIERLEESIRRDASPMDWYFGYLAMAYYFADRPADSVATLQKMKAPWNVNLAAAYARLGKLDEARSSIAKLLKAKPGWTIQKEAVWPTTKQPQHVEPLLTTYLADLAKAGLPVK